LNEKILPLVYGVSSYSSTIFSTMI